MPLVTLRDVTLSFGPVPLLDKVSFTIDDRERICILGRNGMGKSTLLKLLHGDIIKDDGEISRQPHLVTAKLEQDVPQDIVGTVYEVIALGLGERGELLANYQHLIHQMGHDHDPALLKKMETLQHALDKHQAWSLSHKIENIITRLGLSGDEDFAALSGGLKRRVLLGQAIVTEPHILLLDEPTNHLDIDAIDWLESFIKEFSGTVVFITHDRVFLQKLATRMLEIDRGNVQSYPGNYQQYLERKDHELEVEQAHNKNFDKKLAQEEVWIRQGIKARRTRNEGRVRALEKLRLVRQDRREVTGKASMQLQQAGSSGKLVIDAENISYRYENKTLINNFSTIIMRGDKVGIIGPNGVGKSTLLKLLLGQLLPQTGTIKQGTKIEVAYFDQLRAQLNEDKTVAENVSYGDQFVQINDRPVHVIGYLQDFLFSPDRSRLPVKALSGGERNRLLLAKLFSKPANVLVLDEPTNDLDIETLELLEELLINFAGTVLLVSHDRYFLNNVVTSTIVFEGDGQVQEYVGGYDDWIRQRAKPAAAKPKVESLPAPKPDQQQQKLVRALELKIEKLEATQASLHQQMADPSLYEAAKAHQLKTLQQKLQRAETELAQAVVEWEKLVGP